MGKAPIKPDEIYSELTNDYKNILGTDLVSIILYGSGASGHYIPGKSDLNFLIVLTDAGMGALEKTFDLVVKWKKRQVAVPLLMTREDVQSSLDAYPIEILNMSLHYVLVFGEDVLKGLVLRRDCLRLQLEREMRGKLLLLRQGFLGTEGKEKPLRNLIRVSLTAFLSAFNGMLYLKGISIPQDRSALINAAEEAFAIDKDLFHQCLEIRKGIDRFSKKEVSDIFQGYVKEIAKLCDEIDKIKI